MYPILKIVRWVRRVEIDDGLVARGGGRKSAEDDEKNIFSNKNQLLTHSKNVKYTQ